MAQDPHQTALEAAAADAALQTARLERLSVEELTAKIEGGLLTARLAAAILVQRLLDEIEAAPLGPELPNHLRPLREAVESARITALVVLAAIVIDTRPGIPEHAGWTERWQRLAEAATEPGGFDAAGLLELLGEVVLKPPTVLVHPPAGSVS